MNQKILMNYLESTFYAKYAFLSNKMLFTVKVSFPVYTATNNKK